MTSQGKTIGIPRALLYYTYGTLWTRFFEELGFEVVVSPKTDRALFEEGDRRSVDECCLASKVYLGHVSALLPRCDALFVPCYCSGDVRSGFCTKYQSLPDMVKATFREEAPRILSLQVSDVRDKKRTQGEFVEFAKGLGASARDARRAWKRASKAQEAHNSKLAATQNETIKLLERYRVLIKGDPSGTERPPLSILLVAHPYIAHDEHIAGDIIRCLEQMDATVLFADRGDDQAAIKRSFEFSETLPWLINRALVGRLLELKDKVDGIILLSAFPCGPDSMFDDAVMRHVEGIPILNLMIDAQSGSAGVETRIESFVDILRFKDKGSYLER